MCVGEDRSGGSKVFDLGEARHEFGSCDAAALVHQLDGCPFAVVGHAVAHQHVEFTVIVFDGQHHGHRLTDLDQTRHLRRPRTFTHLQSNVIIVSKWTVTYTCMQPWAESEETDLNLHPASDIITGEISTDDVEHVDGERSEGDGFFVLVVPRASQFPGLVPDLLDLRVELDDDGVLEEGARTGLRSVSVESVLRVAAGAARVDAHVERGRRPSQTGRQMDAVDVGVVTLAEDDSVERLVELNRHLHQILLALDVKGNDARHVVRRRRPRIRRCRRRGQCHRRLRGNLGLFMLIGCRCRW